MTISVTIAPEEFSTNVAQKLHEARPLEVVPRIYFTGIEDDVHKF